MKQPSKLRITIRYMFRFCVDQTFDDETQSRKWKIDIDGLLSLETCSSCFILSFTTSQIDQVKFTSSCWKFTIDFFLIFNNDGEDRMRSWWLSIHFSESRHSVTLTNIIFMSNFFLIFHHELHQTVNLYSLVRNLTNFKFFLFWVFVIFAWIYQQINKLFIVQLQETDTNKIFLWRSSIFDSLKNVTNGSRDNTL